MKRIVVGVLPVCLLLFAAAPALGAARQVSSGNYYFQDNATGSRQQVVVNRGDQVVVTIAEAPVAAFLGAHTVDIDELNVHSGDLTIGQTFTTPPLTKVGTFTLYCNNHRNQGHLTRLVVKAPPAKPAEESADPAASAPGADAGPGTATAQPVPLTGQAIPLPALTIPTAAPTTSEPAGVGEATPQQLRAAGIDPDSLEGLIGRNVGGNQPWTRALWFLLIGGVAVTGAAVIAIVRGRSLAAVAAARAAKSSRTAESSSGPPRSSGRSRKSSPRKASASGRKSGGRRR
jgi:hypothetical protein